MKYHELLKAATKKLEAADVYSGAAQQLLIELCKRNDIDLYAEYNQEADEMVVDNFNQAIKRLLKNEPLDHIIGYTTFYGYDFIIDRRALIPRPETEELVEEVIMILDAEKKRLIGLDIGTGSGVIAITLALEAENTKMYGCDIAKDALELALENAIKFDAEVILKQSDLFSAFSGKTKFDFIVCNPPYIKNEESLVKSVDDFEPHIALFGGVDGLDFYRRIFREANAYMKPRNFLAFEIGYDQGEALVKLAKTHFPQAQVIIRQDINGKDRKLFIFNNWPINWQ